MKTLYHGSWTLNTIHSISFSLCLLWSLLVSLSLPCLLRIFGRHGTSRHCICPCVQHCQYTRLYVIYYINYIYIYLSCHFSQVFLQAYFEINGSSSLLTAHVSHQSFAELDHRQLWRRLGRGFWHLNLRVVPIHYKTGKTKQCASVRANKYLEQTTAMQVAGALKAKKVHDWLAEKCRKASSKQQNQKQTINKQKIINKQPTINTMQQHSQISSRSCRMAMWYQLRSH